MFATPDQGNYMVNFVGFATTIGAGAVKHPPYLFWQDLALGCSKDSCSPTLGGQANLFPIGCPPTLVYIPRPFAVFDCLLA